MLFGRDVAERVYYRKVIYYPTSPNQCLHYLGKHEPRNCLFSYAVCHV